MSSLLRVENLSVGFANNASAVAGAGGRGTVVRGVSFEIEKAKTFALLGESGSGKSVTALALMRLLPPAGQMLSGNIFWQNNTDSPPGGAMSMIFQEPASSLNPVLSVGRQIGEVLALRQGLRGARAKQAAAALLRQVGIADAERRLDEYPFQMSGGMKQRVMTAMALASEPRLLIADEPTTALDVTVQAQILELLTELQSQRSMAIMLITHDLGVAARMSHHVGVMYAGELIEIAPRQQFFTSPAHPYSRALFSTLPGVGKRGQPLHSIPGQMSYNNNRGCAFAARCQHATQICTDSTPGWTFGEHGQAVRCHQCDFKLAESAETGSSGEDNTGTDNGELPMPPLADKSVLLQVEHLQVLFPVRKGLFRRQIGAVRAADDISLHIEEGKTLALVGESGCGKTTVGKAILRLVEPTAGLVRLDGLELSAGKLESNLLYRARRKAQMVFQDPFASLNPRLSVGEILSEGLDALQAWPRKASKSERHAALNALLQQVGLEAAALHRYPHEFSGGQRQRIAIARVLAVSPRLMICDEPTSALDVSIQAQIINLLRDIQMQTGVACLFITHNFAVVEYLAHTVAVMYLGRIVEAGETISVLQNPRHPYTQSLIAAVPKIDPQSLAPTPLPGETPSPVNPPVGCYFHPRCARADQRCRAQYPPTSEIAQDWQVACWHGSDGMLAESDRPVNQPDSASITPTP